MAADPPAAAAEAVASPLEQVLLTSLRKEPAEICVVRLDPVDRTIWLTQVTSGPNEQLVWSGVKNVDLSAIASVEQGPTTIGLLDATGDRVVMLHFERDAELRAWGAAVHDGVASAGARPQRPLNPPGPQVGPAGASGAPADEPPASASAAAANGRPAGAPPDPLAGDGQPQPQPQPQQGQVMAAGGGVGPEEMKLLEQSRGLQRTIAHLEEVGRRRDAQLKKMTERLEGSLEMLTAVDEMCDQQLCVIKTQKIVIRELLHEAAERAEGAEGAEGAEDAEGAEGAEGAGGAVDSQAAEQAAEVPRRPSGAEQPTTSDPAADGQWHAGADGTRPNGHVNQAAQAEMLDLLAQTNLMRRQLEQLEAVEAQHKAKQALAQQARRSRAAASPSVSPGSPTTPAPTPTSSQSRRGDQAENVEENLMKRLEDMQQMMEQIGRDESGRGVRAVEPGG